MFIRQCRVLFEFRGFCPRWGSIENSVGKFSMVPNNCYEYSQFNFDSTRFRYAKDALITFCFTRVSCDIQIRQLINDIKCASASADCVTLCHSATVINIRIFDLKPLPTFLHNVIMHISKKKNEWITKFIIVWTWNYDYDNTHWPFCRYLITDKGTSDEDIRNDFTILYVHDPIL